MTARRVIVIHGCGGSPEGNWFPWLKNELAVHGVDCLVPRMPQPEEQTLSSWQAAFDMQIPHGLQSDDILIGHSTGTLLAMRLLEKRTSPIIACYLICPFTQDLGGPYDVYNRTFYAAPFNWPRIKAGAQSITIYAGTDDPYVPMSEPQIVANATGAQLHFITDGKHLNAEGGYTHFPALLAALTSSLKK